MRNGIETFGKNIYMLRIFVPKKFCELERGLMDRTSWRSISVGGLTCTDKKKRGKILVGGKDSTAFGVAGHQRGGYDKQTLATRVRGAL